MKDSSTITLRDIEMIKGFNHRFFYVQKNTMSQADELIELKLSFDMHKFYPRKRVILEHTSGTLLKVVFDSDCSNKTDSYWTINGEAKVGIPSIKNRLMLLDNEMNKRVIE